MACGCEVMMMTANGTTEITGWCLIAAGSGQSSCARQCGVDRSNRRRVEQGRRRRVDRGHRRRVPARIRAVAAVEMHLQVTETHTIDRSADRVVAERRHVRQPGERGQEEHGRQTTGLREEEDECHVQADEAGGDVQACAVQTQVDGEGTAGEEYWMDGRMCTCRRPSVPVARSRA